jgi:Ca2+/Na+ antiporter
MEEVLLSVTNVAAGLLFGAMVAFAGFFAPLAFARLPEEISGPFIRGLFPIYYLAGTVVAAVAAFAAVSVRQPEAIVLWLVALGFLFSRYYLMPRTVAAHDDRERGVIGAAERFADLHKRSAFLNMVQIIATMVVLIRIV